MPKNILRYYQILVKLIFIKTWWIIFIVNELCKNCIRYIKYLLAKRVCALGGQVWKTFDNGDKTNWGFMFEFYVYL
jgi:hypothetical protein